MAKSMKLGGGGRFQKLQNSVAKEYEGKGKTHEAAKKIAGAIAANAGRKKYGNTAMSNMSNKGKKK